MSKIDKAKGLATYIHRSQMYGDKIYMYHIEEVVKLVERYGEEATITAYLHDAKEDVLEEDKAFLNEELSHFSEKENILIDYLTDEEGVNRKERKAKTYAKLSKIEVDSFEKIALIVKAADRLVNIRECVKNKNQSLLKMYQKEHEAFMSAVYREGICEEIFIEIKDKIKTNLKIKIKPN